MIDRSKSIIPDVDAIVCLLDETIAESLNSHDTYKVKSLFSQLWKLNHSENSSTELLEEILEKIYNAQSHVSSIVIANKIQAFIKENKSLKSSNTGQFNIKPFIAEGINCNLLQSDGKGWQKGKLKICFSFTPEENEPAPIQKEPIETHSSPLDEIRQLANELASVGSIEQN